MTDRGDARACDPSDPEAPLCDFHAARNDALGRIQKRDRGGQNNSPEVAAGVIVASSILALAEAVQGMTRQMERFVDAYEEG